MNEFSLRKATRQNIKPLVCFYSESGCGKTMSALLLARGFVGPTGKIGLADSESRRGELYADVIPGGYETVSFEPPFTPARYIQVQQAIVQGGAQIGIIDSGSHEWEGIGGVLDMAGENEQRSGKAGLHNWKTPKLEHAKFVLSLLQSPIPLIICLRAKYKTRQIKENGKTAIVKDDYTTPIQADDFIFEMTAHAEILQDHSINLTKCSHPSLRKCFPEKGPISIEHGELLAAWCASAGKQNEVKPPAKAATTATRQWMFKQLKDKFDDATLTQYAIDKTIIMPDQGLLDWPLEKVPTTPNDMNQLLTAVEAHL